MRHAIWGGAALVMTLWTTPAAAWTCIDATCPVFCSTPVRYQVGVTPPGLDEGAVLAEIQRAAESWNESGCFTAPVIEYAGRVSDGRIDGAIQINWVEAWTLSSTVVSDSQPVWTDGCVLGATIQHNLQDFTWTLDMGGGELVDVYTASLVAFGRGLGLGPSEDSTAVLGQPYSGPVTGLGADDMAGICALYAEEAPDAGVDGSLPDATADASPPPDASAGDATPADGGTPPDDDGGCGCAVERPRSRRGLLFFGGVAVALIMRRKRREISRED